MKLPSQWVEEVIHLLDITKDESIFVASLTKVFLACQADALANVTRFDAGPVPGQKWSSWMDAELYRISIEKRAKDAWVIVDYTGAVLNKNGEWDFESQTEDFIANTRFKTAFKAFVFLEEWRKKQL